MDWTPKVVEAAAGLSAFFERLQSAGFTLIGPQPRDGAILYGEISTPEDLPRGWTERQDAGRYRLERRIDQAFFGFSVGPHAHKRFLHVPSQELWRIERVDGEATLKPIDPDPRPYAFIGMRACEIRAVAIQDRVLMHGAFEDRHYAARRRDNFVLAVQCGMAGGTCFCASMDAGPRARAGFDLSLTELIDGDRHDFLVEIGSARGADLLSGVPHRAAGAEDIAWSERISAAVASDMGRTMEANGVRDLLMRNLEHPRWDEVAGRCLACTNCTSVCPTCFCTRDIESTDFSSETASHGREWDSCFDLDFSYLHGGSVRRSTKARYRQWMTHKLATWVDQFGESGCVGCGRCITWCPVGIDITEEVRAMRESEAIDG